MEATTLINVTKQGNRWIASDGTTHAEGECPADAVLQFEMLKGGFEPELDKLDRARTRLGNSLMRVAQIAYMDKPCPTPVINSELQVLRQALVDVENFKENL